MGNTLATDTIPVLVTMVDVHNPKAQDQFYFCNVSSGGASTKVIGRSQTLSVEVGITTVLSMTIYECPEPVFTPETARCLGVLRVPIERLAERYSSGVFQQWFNLDTRTDPRAPAGDPQQLVNRFEQAYTDAVMDIYQPKICVSVIGSAFEVQRGARQAFSIFVGEDVKTQAGPDLKALIASHKQQAAYIDALHEEVRRLNAPSYRPMAQQSQPVQRVQYTQQPIRHSVVPTSSPYVAAPVLSPRQNSYTSPVLTSAPLLQGGSLPVMSSSYAAPVNTTFAQPVNTSFNTFGVPQGGPVPSTIMSMR